MRKYNQQTSTTVNGQRVTTPAIVTQFDKTTEILSWVKANPTFSRQLINKALHAHACEAARQQKRTSLRSKHEMHTYTCRNCFLHFELSANTPDTHFVCAECNSHNICKLE